MGVGKMSRVFLTADLHFGDASIIEYEKRPFSSVEAMDEALIANWNCAVSDNDTIIVAGDFSSHGAERTTEILKQLKGRKILVRGNHDWMSSEAYGLAGFSEVSSRPIIHKDWFVISHEPPHYYNDSMPFFYIYGHVHGTELYPTITKQSACVCVERWDYRPVDFHDLLERAGLTKTEG